MLQCYPPSRMPFEIPIRAYVGDLQRNRQVVDVGREQKRQEVARQMPWEARKPVRMVLFWRER
jgi:hypothetical protein